MTEVKKIRKREELDPSVCWSISDLFPSDQAWEEAFQALGQLPEEAAAWRGRLGESAQSLYYNLTLSEAFDVRI